MCGLPKGRKNLKNVRVITWVRHFWGWNRQDRTLELAVSKVLIWRHARQEVRREHRYRGNRLRIASVKMGVGDKRWWSELARKEASRVSVNLRLSSLLEVKRWFKEELKGIRKFEFLESTPEVWRGWRKVWNQVTFMAWIESCEDKSPGDEKYARKCGLFVMM